YCMIGAGSIVTKDVPDYALFLGNPAEQQGWMCACGERLPENLICSACGTAYRQNGEKLEPK
ncbi:MAG: N-acetyltransferase, partial [Deltaproteobacteria bacterium]|nr:N-acetyltransferase [Deltaproteobacteria bacterium]